MMAQKTIFQFWIIFTIAVVKTESAPNISISTGIRATGGLPYSFDYLLAADDFFDTPATVVFLDYDSPEEIIAKYNVAGITVFCLVNVGSWEFWREDANIFPSEVLGNDYEGWPGEKWLDITNMNVILPIMRERFRSAAGKGCKGIAADNMFAWEIENTGFDITPQDQLVYNRIIAAEIQVLGLMSGLVQDIHQASDLVHQYDFGVIAKCAAKLECNFFEVFVANGKPVFAIEYTDVWDEEGFKNAVCSMFGSTGFSFILKNLIETADFRVSCV